MTSATGGASDAAQGIGGESAADPLRAMGWRTARGELTLDVPRIMGVINLNTDSFWEGSRAAGVEAAVAAAERMLEDGADLLDLGGESTRPGAAPVDCRAELERVVPVVRELSRRFPAAFLSIDTIKSEVARAALAEGAAVINDVSALRLDPGMGPAVAGAGAGLILMHSRGDVATMATYEMAAYEGDVVEIVKRELDASMRDAGAAGVLAEQIVLDPGFGFAKRTEHSLALLSRLQELLTFGRPVLIGASRKRFVGELAGRLRPQAGGDAPQAILPPEERLDGTIAACVAGLLRGARIFRAHDVKPLRRALAVAEAIHRGTP